MIPARRFWPASLLGRVGLAVASLLAAGLGSAPAVRADTPPSVWDLARDPEQRARWDLHVRVERLLHPPASEEAVLASRRDLELNLEAARAMLEEADAAHSADVRLRFDLGIVYQDLGELQARQDMHERAVAVLGPALELAPDHPAATEALSRLVFAYARLDRPRDELAGWQRLIPRLTDDHVRASDMMNMGEAEMRLGRIDDALGTFREVLRLCGAIPNASQTYVLTLWDLAVALDRSGDPVAAVDAAAKASAMTVVGSGGLITGSRIIAEDPAVFFVPEWEREWYLALRASAAQRGARDARDAAALWADAERHWDTYIERARAAGTRERWLAIAAVRRDRVHAQRISAEKRAARLPPREPMGAAE